VCYGDSCGLGSGRKLCAGGLSVLNHPYDMVSMMSDTGQLHIIQVGKVR